MDEDTKFLKIITPNRFHELFKIHIANSQSMALTILVQKIFHLAP